ncbi:uncharacterized protein LOC143361005 [Halictus rubicundus]|uniref:uncharacterized protein LOC143361005 n=1 Tax=Halictus rubicundus TaxID=77578 RepID=UPI004036468B
MLSRKRLKPGSIPTILPKKSRCEPQTNILRESNGRDNNDVLATFATTEEVPEPIMVVECNHSPTTSNQTHNKDFSSPCTSKTANVREKCQITTLHDKIQHDHCYHNTPRSTMKKLDHMQRRLQSITQENRRLKQQARRLKKRKTFNLALPHADVLRTWYSSVNAEPGFTEESFATLKEKSGELKEKGQRLLCAVIFDEMGIKKDVRGVAMGQCGVM